VLLSGNLDFYLEFIMKKIKYSLTNFNIKTKPIPPGEILQDEFLIPLGMSRENLANMMEVNVKIINDICSDESPITPDIAIGLSKVFKTSQDFWINMQNFTDSWNLKNKDQNK